MCLSDKRVPNRWASAVCVSRSMMSDTSNATGFGLTNLSDEVMEYCTQLADALLSGEVAMEVDDGDDW